MSIQELRSKLIKDIKKANETELRSILKYYQIAQQQKDNDASWQNLPQQHKTKIAKGLQQLKEGKVVPASKLISRLNKKYGIA